MAYEVQENCLFGGWTNTWSYEDDNGVTIPTIFDTREDAEAELEWFFQEMQEAFESGNMTDIPDRYDFRIVEIIPKEDNDFYHVQQEHESMLVDQELEAWVRTL